MTDSRSPVRLLVAAGTYGQAKAAAKMHGLAPSAFLMLTYETHRALPNVPLHVDPSWSAHRNADALADMIAVRCTPPSSALN